MLRDPIARALIRSDGVEAGEVRRVPEAAPAPLAPRRPARPAVYRG